MVAESVSRYLDSLPEEAQASPHAQLALELARRLDECGARETSALSKELRETLSEVSKRAGDGAKETSKLDELTARRSARQSDAADPARTAAGEQRGPGGG